MSVPTIVWGLSYNEKIGYEENWICNIEYFVIDLLCLTEKCLSFVFQMGKVIINQGELVTASA